MVKPHGSLRYMLALNGGGAFFDIDPFTLPDEFGNVMGTPGGLPQTPAMITTWLLVNPGALGDLGKVTIFPVSIAFDPVTGNTTDVVLRVTNDSAGLLVFFLNILVPSVANQGL